MRTRRAGGDVPVEVQVEARIEGNVIPVDFNHMDLVVTLSLHNSARGQIFDQEIVGHHET